MNLLPGVLRYPTALWAIFLGACAVAMSNPAPAARPSALTDEQIRLPLVQKDDLVYTGAFRLPAPLNKQQTFEWGGTALSYWPAHNSLLLVGLDWHQQVAEVSIPDPGRGSTLDELPRAEFIQPLTDILRGNLKTIDGETTNGVKIGGITALDSSLVVTAWSFYDSGVQTQTRSHFVTGQDFSSLGSIAGPYQVGTGFQSINQNDRTRIAGFVSGYMSPIPKEWQPALGGTHLTGQGTISILRRTSAGPSASVFTPTELGSKTPASAKIVMGYPIDSDSPNSGLNHPTLGVWGEEGGLYNGTQYFKGMVFPDGTRSVLFFGWGGDKFCYGPNTSNAALHFKTVPGTNNQQHYCYDPVPSNEWTGPHSYPSKSLVFAYDVEDFIDVKNDSKRPWEVRPYATWNFTLPFQSTIVNGLDLGNVEIQGAAYDPVRRRLFISSFLADNSQPLIHVFVLKSALTPAP